VPNPKFAISSTVAWVNEVGLANLKWQMLFRVTLVQGITMLKIFQKITVLSNMKLQISSYAKSKFLSKKLSTLSTPKWRNLAEFWQNSGVCGGVTCSK